MTEPIVNADPSQTGQAQAPAPVQGQSVEQNSGQASSAAPEAVGKFKSPEELYKSYEELQKKLTVTSQELAELRKTQEQYIPVPEANHPIGNGGHQPIQPNAQDDEVVRELADLGIPVNRLEQLIERGARKLYEADPLRHELKNTVYALKDTVINTEFAKAESRGLKGITGYKDKIANYYRSNPDKLNASLDDVYKIVVFDDLMAKANQPPPADPNQHKRQASTEGPGMSLATPSPSIRSLGDSLRFELGKK